MPVTINDNHRIVGAASVNLGMPNGTITPRRIVVHYTAGSTLSGAINALQGGGNSYNVLINVNGTYHQARPFNKSAGHAGRSNWKESRGVTNFTSVNGDSIGISMVNLGNFGYFAQGKWWYGFEDGQPQNPSIADEDANKHSLIYRPDRPSHWTPYDPRQLPACKALIAALIEKYDTITEIVGHHDVAIDGKSDPGPLCPLEDWRREFDMQGSLGFQAKARSPDNELNVRDRPGTDGRVVKVLRNGDIVHIRSITYTSASRGIVRPRSGRALTAWASVDLDGNNTHGGFVYTKFLDKTPLDRAYANAL
jgi:N-acetylmuramoyl-L-alanine amidase